MEPITISVKDAAKALGLSLSTTNELIKTKALDTCKIGRRRLVTTQSIHALIEKQRQEAEHG